VLITIESDNPEMSFLLHKNPARLHSDTTSFGTAHAFYPAGNRVALLLDIEPLKLTRRGGADSFALQPYVNDRAYVANSFLSVALNQLFRTAVAGRCKERPELVETPMKLKVSIPTLPCRGGSALLKSLFEPLGYSVNATRIPLDPAFPDWGDSVYYRTELEKTARLYSVLRHLYVLLPVLDDDKHYWVGEHEIEKLLEKGEAWLADHPYRELIINRYLKHQRGLSRQAQEALSEEEVEVTDSLTREESAEKKIGLHGLRLDAVVDVLKASGAARVADLGCGEGKLVRRLLKEPQFSQILAMDVSVEALAKAELALNRLHHKNRERVELLQGSLLYDDERLHGVEAACLVEVIEHLEPDRLARVAHTLFQRIRPRTLVVTTPNRDYNVLWETLPAGRFRHLDHRFEWSREEFREWVKRVKHDYDAAVSGLGEEHPEFGSPSQMAVFQR
jgi:3' terminal RNA ribose 2'-O-methyltransferase Hen1